MSSPWRELLWVLLFPMSLVWRMVTSLRRGMYQRFGFGSSSLFPTVCIGNIHSGGSGKTPLVRLIANHFADLQPGIVCSGYGGEEYGRVQFVQRESLVGFKKYGDEAWMFARSLKCPIIVGRDRTRAVKLLQDENVAKFGILDDGYQHLKFNPKCKVISIYCDRSPDESFTIPLGDLRESFSSLKYCDALVLVDSASENSHFSEWQSLLAEQHPQIPVFQMKKSRLRTMNSFEEPALLLSTDKVFAFCAIARGARFVSDLKNITNVVGYRLFSDHHQFTDLDITQITLESQKVGAQYVVMTEKDWVKLGAKAFSILPKAYFLSIDYEIGEEFWYFLQKKLWRS